MQKGVRVGSALLMIAKIEKWAGSLEFHKTNLGPSQKTRLNKFSTSQVEHDHKEQKACSTVRKVTVKSQSLYHFLIK